jgi:hypothetical protein
MLDYLQNIGDIDYLHLMPSHSKTGLMLALNHHVSLKSNWKRSKILGNKKKKKPQFF